MGLFTKAQAPKNLLQTLKGHKASVTGCALSPDDNFVVSSSDDTTLKIWDVATGALRATLEGHTGPVNGCAISTDGSFVVSASTDATLRVWDLPDGTTRKTLAEHAALGCAISRDGSLIVSVGGVFSDMLVKFWDVESGQERVAPGDHVACWDCAISPDGTFAVSAGCDLKGHQSGNDLSVLKVWDVSNGWVRNTLSGRSAGDTVTKETHTVFTSCAISSVGSFIASTSLFGTARLWDAETGEEIRTWLASDEDLLMTCALWPDDTLIATGTSLVKVWETQTGRERATFEGHPVKGRTGTISALAVSSDGTFLVTASSDGTLKIWDAAAALAGAG